MGAETVANISAVLERGTYQPPIPSSNAPTLTIPANMTVEASSPSEAVVTFTATASDQTDPNPTVVCTPPSGSTFPLGTTTIHSTATDSEDNSSSGSFTITVVDTPPTLNMPAHMTILATTPSGTVVTFSVTLTDTVDPNATLECSPPSSSFFPIGTTTVQCTATDASANQASESFTVTVIEATYQLHLPLVRRE